MYARRGARGVGAAMFAGAPYSSGWHEARHGLANTRAPFLQFSTDWGKNLSFLAHSAIFYVSSTKQLPQC